MWPVERSGHTGGKESCRGSPTCENSSCHLPLRQPSPEAGRPHLPREGRSLGQCPKSEVSVLRAEGSSFSVLLNQHFRLNHHLEKQLQSGAQSRWLQAQRQLLHQWGPGGAQGNSCTAGCRLLHGRFLGSQNSSETNYSFRLHSELQPLAF